MKNYELASPNIRPNSPKSSPNEQTHILPQLEEGPVELEFVDDGREDKSCHDLKFKWICKMFDTSVVMGTHGPETIPNIS
jgi:hypothetical protein